MRFNASRRRFLRGLLLGGAALGSLGGASLVQAYQFGVTRHSRAIRGLKRPVTVAFLSDLHYGPYIKAGQLRAWVEATNALRPDLMLLGGDQFDQGLNTLPEPFFAELGRLRAPLGVYGVWGNHDYNSFGVAGGRNIASSVASWPAKQREVQQALAQVGVNILKNQGVAVRDDLYVAGLDDLWYGQPDLAAALSGAGNQARLLVSHNPDILPDLPPGLDLVLSGHTHGGQVRLPFIGAPVVPSRYGQRYAMGWFNAAQGTPAFVSRGLGVSGLPVRNLCQPEIALLTLVPVQN